MEEVTGAPAACEGYSVNQGVIQCYDGTSMNLNGVNAYKVLKSLDAKFNKYLNEEQADARYNLLIEMSYMIAFLVKLARNNFRGKPIPTSFALYAKNVFERLNEADLLSDAALNNEYVNGFIEGKVDPVPQMPGLSAEDLDELGIKANRDIPADTLAYLESFIKSF